MKRFVGITLLILLTSAVFAQEKEKPTQPDFPGDLMLDYGFNFWNDAPEKFPTKFWGSNSIGLYYSKRFKISNRIAFHISPGFTIDKYASKRGYAWQSDEDGALDFDSLRVSFAKNKLVATYLDIPVEFRIHPLGTQNGEGWFIGLGGFLGRRLGAHTKLKYQNATGEYKEKFYSDFDLVDFRYGLQARFGFRSFHLFYKHYLNNVFNESVDQDSNPQAWTIGINVSGF